MDPVSIPSIPAASFPLPPRLEGLRRLAYNLRWAWDPRTRNLWSLVDRTAWTRYRNPIPVISGPDGVVPPPRRREVPGRVPRRPGRVRPLHGRRLGPLVPPASTATSSTARSPTSAPNTGSTNRSGIYSGGLGVLAGDHMKSASDMALPFIGVGLLYRKGYFRQSIDADGHQEHNYPDYDLTRLPISRVQDENGLPLTVTSSCPGAMLAIAVWLAQVGRVPVLLLDTDVAENAVEDRADHPHPVRPRPRDASASGARAGHRRCAGDPRTRPGPGRLAPQRGPLGVPARRTGPRVRRGRCGARGCLGKGAARQRVHDPHARSRPATNASTSSSSDASPARCSTPAACP